MRRRDLVAIMAAVVLVRPYGVTAQDQPKKYLVGSLNTGGAIPDNSPYGDALIRGLAQHGYELDKNLAMLRRGADLHLDRLPQLVDEMVASHVVGRRPDGEGDYQEVFIETAARGLYLRSAMPVRQPSYSDRTRTSWSAAITRGS